MIVLDTKVISELMRPVPAPAVVSWLRAQSADQVFTTAVTAAELWCGVHLMDLARRRSAIELRMQVMQKQDSAGRILDFTGNAAAEYGRLHAAQMRGGRMPDIANTQIAAIAEARDFAVVTRNVAGFAHAGLQVINPWEQ